ncbi:MAG: DUF6249 domain-containing protein [Fermentimonas sp.]|jgi:hypothetical protein
MEVLIPILGVICAVGLPIVAGMVLGIQWIKARNMERMGLINQGIIPLDSPRRRRSPNRLVSLRNGIVLIALGIGIIVGFLCMEYLVIGSGNTFWVIGASVVFFLGVGYLTYFLVVQKMPHLEKEDAETGRGEEEEEIEEEEQE